MLFTTPRYVSVVFLTRPLQRHSQTEVSLEAHARRQHAQKQEAHSRKALDRVMSLDSKCKLVTCVGMIATPK